MKKLIFLFITVFFLLSCDSMENNYQDYLINIQQYSPKVTNLKFQVPETGTVVLTWTNPGGDTAVKIKIDTGNKVYETTEMVNTYRLENLEIKGYTVSVYTIDSYGNSSVPTSVSFFPKP